MEMGGPLMRFPAVIHKDEETGYGVISKLSSKARRMGTSGSREGADSPWN